MGISGRFKSLWDFRLRKIADLRLVPFIIIMAVLFVFNLSAINDLSFNLRSKLGNWWLDHCLWNCCKIRKQPWIMLSQKAESVLVSLETSCPLSSGRIIWEMYEISNDWEYTSIAARLEIEVADTVFVKMDRRYLYRANVDLLKLMNVANDKVSEERKQHNHLQLKHRYHFIYSFNRDKSGTYRDTHWFNPTCLVMPSITSDNTSSSFPSSCYPIRMVWISDNQFAAVNFRRVVYDIKRRHGNSIMYVLHTGDAVQHAESLAEWQTDFFDIFQKDWLGNMEKSSLISNAPLIHAFGNHDDFNAPSFQWPDSDGSLGSSGRKHMVPVRNLSHHHHYLYTASPLSPSSHWEAMSIGPWVRLIKLNSNLAHFPQQLEFLKKEVQSAEFRRARFRLILMHVPVWMEFWDSDTWERGGESEWSQVIRRDYQPLFEKYECSLVLSGHQHNYQRAVKTDSHRPRKEAVHSVVYVIGGGAGATIDKNRVAKWKGLYQVEDTRNHHYALLDIFPNVLIFRVYKAAQYGANGLLFGSKGRQQADEDSVLIDKLEIKPVNNLG